MRRGTGKGRTNAGRPGCTPPSRDNDAIEAMADVAAEVADTSEGLDCGDQASRSAGALPEGLLQHRLDKTTAEKDKANAEKAKAIKDLELVRKQLEEAKAELELAKTYVGSVVDVPITLPANKV
jgi:hypothetical protein